MKTTTTWMVVACLVTLTLCGCKPYCKPEYKVVQACESAFVIPMEGDVGKQARLDSIAEYEKNKVMTKRITIPKRWNQTGRAWFSGEWIPNVSVITVNRSPVTRIWTAERETGTSDKYEPIEAESADSIGFSIPITCTAYIEEKDASTFLYWYPSDSLSGVMDNQIRMKIQETITSVANKYDLDHLRAKKSEFTDALYSNVVPFFKSFGVTISQIGIAGGLCYENDEIQKTIDAVFCAQQEKARELALLDAMENKENRLKREGVAQANQTREIARGRKDALELEAEGQANAIRQVVKALGEASSNPDFIKLRSLEVEQARVAKWDGKSPQFMMGNGNGFVPLMQIPSMAYDTDEPISPPRASVKVAKQ